MQSKPAILPKVSVIIPAYNASNFIKNSVDFIKKQSFTYFECIFVDDGSLDNTVNLIEEFTADDKRFKLAKNLKNLGQAASRNKGLKIAKGKYIIWLDVDDIYSPELLQKIYDKAEQTKADITITNLGIINTIHRVRLSSVIYGKNIPQYTFALKDLSKGMSPRRFSLFRNELWNKLFNRQFLLNNKLHLTENIKRCDDLDLSIRSLLVASRIAFIDEPLVTYVSLQNGSNQSTVSAHPLAICYSLENIYNFMLTTNNLSEFIDDFNYLALDNISFILKNCDVAAQSKLIKYYPNFIKKTVSSKTLI